MDVQPIVATLHCIKCTLYKSIMQVVELISVVIEHLVKGEIIQMGPRILHGYYSATDAS